LPGDEPLGEPLEDAHEQVLHRTEVVVDQSMVGSCCFGEPPGADVGVADLNEQAFGGIQETFFGCDAVSGICHVHSLVHGLI